MSWRVTTPAAGAGAEEGQPAETGGVPDEEDRVTTGPLEGSARPAGDEVEDGDA
jgi:hypothetical protein